MAPPPETPALNPGHFRILVVDDNPDTLEVIGRNLTGAGYHVLTASGVEAAVDILSTESVALVITDYKMPRLTGIDLVRHIQANNPETEVMMITGFASVEGAVQAMKDGAQEYLAKPFTDEELLSSVEKVLRRIQGRGFNDPEDDEVGTLSDFGVIGRSPAMQRLSKAVRKAAKTPVTVLITGETGTGKELIARAIHYSGSRATAPFVPVNCGGIPEGMLERELFGHLKGSFTGATETRAGFFQTANGGSLFLDEISETSTAMQVKLLRVLQEKEICMVGDTRPFQLDVRLIAASNKLLHQLVEKGIFREDLYYRLAVVTIDVPPLRERAEDVALLTQHFAERLATLLGRPRLVFSDRVLEALQGYDWPGNVRELENLVQRLTVMLDDAKVELSDLPRAMRFSVERGGGIRRTLRAVELEHIKRVLESVEGNKSEAGRILGITRKTLREKLKTDPAE